MEEFDIYRTSFQSLRLLEAVHKEGSITAAADRFAMNQSSVSYTIDRLREVFNDPLFVRAGRGIAPTARCDRIVDEARQMIERFEALSRETPFEAASAQAHFTISCNFHERTVLLPDLLRRLRRQAPGVRLAVIQANTSAARQLREGLCDIALSPVGSDQPGIRAQRLFSERYACFTDPAHPLARSGIKLADYAAARHVQVQYAEGWRPYYQAHLDGLGIRIDPVIEVPSLGAVEHLIAGTDLVLTAPEKLAAVLEPGLTRLAAPFDCVFDEYLSWSERTDASAPHRWLRGLVLETVEALGIA